MPRDSKEFFWSQSRTEDSSIHFLGRVVNCSSDISVFILIQKLEGCICSFRHTPAATCIREYISAAECSFKHSIRGIYKSARLGVRACVHECTLDYAHGCSYTDMYIYTHARTRTPTRQRARGSLCRYVASARSCRGWEFGPWRVPIPPYCARILTLPEPGGRPGSRRVGVTRGERKGSERRGEHILSFRSEVILREYLAGDPE